MTQRRLIDASPFDRLIISVPEDVGDEYSYIRGVEDILYLIRKAETIETNSTDVMPFEKETEQRSSI